MQLTTKHRSVGFGLNSSNSSLAKKREFATRLRTIDLNSDWT